MIFFCFISFIYHILRIVLCIYYTYNMLTLLSPSHHDSASSGLTKDQLGISLAAESMAAAAMHDGL